MLCLHSIKGAEPSAPLGRPAWISGVIAGFSFILTYVTGYMASSGDAGSWAFIVFFGVFVEFFVAVFNPVYHLFYGIDLCAEEVLKCLIIGISSLYADSLNRLPVSVHISFAFSFLVGVGLHLAITHFHGVSVLGFGGKLSGTKQLRSSVGSVEYFYFSIIFFLGLFCAVPLYLSTRISNNIAFSGFAVKIPARVLTDFFLTPSYCTVR